jgi:hypothetical protein
VTGSGFPPGSIVHLSYAGGQSTSTATVDDTGSFTGQLQANALLPGSQQVTARDGAKTAHAQFNQRL